MADSENTTTLPVSRRRLLAGAGAAALAGASTANAEIFASHPDAELLALGEELAAAWAVEKATPEGDAQDAAFDACAAIVAKIAARPASTMEGLKVKAQAFLWCGHEVGEKAEDLICSRTMATDTMVALSIACDLARDVSDDVRRLATWRAA